MVPVVTEVKRSCWMKSPGDPSSISSSGISMSHGGPDICGVCNNTVKSLPAIQSNVILHIIGTISMSKLLSRLITMIHHSIIWQRSRHPLVIFSQEQDKLCIFWTIHSGLLPRAATSQQYRFSWQNVSFSYLREHGECETP